jgi:hypothetical protein
MNHSFTLLGGKVWKQIVRIPMGFSCSQSLCNLYFLFLKYRFIQRLAKLGKVFDMEKIKYVLKYIYDICQINIGDVHQFLDPIASKDENNPF